MYQLFMIPDMIKGSQVPRMWPLAWRDALMAHKLPNIAVNVLIAVTVLLPAQVTPFSSIIGTDTAASLG
jgi:hypothetical protein